MESDNDELRYSLVQMRREVEQAHFDLEFYSITAPEQLKKEESMLRVLLKTLSILYAIYRLYRRVKRVERKFNRMRNSHDRAITKAARRND